MDAPEARRIARAISDVENRTGDYELLLRQAYADARSPWIVGVTGPPGAGKSTLVDLLSCHWAQQDRRVAVVAIDPSSPFSGGAILGDRIRQTAAGGADGGHRVFFRSFASRGHIGGLSATTNDAVVVLGHFGFDTVIVETVGAGQADLEISETADCTVVVSVPGLGDAVQAAKAGLMEIGDIFAVNKADLPGAEECARTIERSLASAYMGKGGVNEWTGKSSAADLPRQSSPGVRALTRRHGDPSKEPATWTPPVLRVSAGQARGVDELAGAVSQFLSWQSQTGRGSERQRTRVHAQVLRHLSLLLMAPYRQNSHGVSPVAAWVDRVLAGTASPLEAAQALAVQGLPAT